MERGVGGWEMWLGGWWEGEGRIGDVVGKERGGGKFGIKDWGGCGGYRLRECMLLRAELGFGRFAGEISTLDKMMHLYGDSAGRLPCWFEHISNTGYAKSSEIAVIPCRMTDGVCTVIIS